MKWKDICEHDKREILNLLKWKKQYKEYKKNKEKSIDKQLQRCYN